MTGKRYYISTLADWQRQAAQFANSHWFALSSVQPDRDSGNGITNHEPGAANLSVLVLVEADEGAHLALEDDPTFEALPHPLAQKPISDAAQKALAGLGIPSGATTFDVAEAFAKFHPLLRHHVF